MLGSSNTYIEPTSAEPSEVANEIRWLSPPLSVLLKRFSVK